jgi:hypothetical protein
MSTAGLDRAYDTTKQVITLSSSIIAFTVTFAKEFKDSSSHQVPWSLKISWSLYCIAVVLGLWTLMAITGTFDALDRGAESNQGRTNIRLPAQLMFIAFVSGIVATIWTGFSL